MESDCILEQERIWNKLKLALISTLGSNTGMSPYDALTLTYDTKLKLLPNDEYKGSNMSQRQKNIQCIG